MRTWINAIFGVARSELIQLCRDRAAVLGLVIVTLLTSWICWNSRSEIKEVARSQFEKQAAAREDWLTQETRSAHMATHRGTSLFKSVSPLAVIDRGIDSQLGTTIRLESHKQGQFINPRIKSESSLFKLDMDTPALILQGLFPLILILLGYSGISLERERGTLGLLMSSGVRWSTLVLGKLLFLILVAGVLALPIMVLTLDTGRYASPEMELREIAGRGLMFWAVNWVYLTAWGAFSLACSARLRSRTALILLVACWTISTIVIPRLAVDVAVFAAPLPPAEEVRDAQNNVLQQPDAARKLQAFTEEFDRQLLAEYHVERIRDVPINYLGAKTMATEEFTDSLLDELNAKLREIHDRQDRIVGRFLFVSPFLAIRSLSMSAAGSDRQHHEQFSRAAEEYRRELVRTMNRADMRQQLPGKTAAERCEFWGRVPPFMYVFPSWTQLMRDAAWPLLVMVAWSGVALAWCLFRRPTAR